MKKLKKTCENCGADKERCDECAGFGKFFMWVPKKRIAKKKLCISKTGVASVVKAKVAANPAWVMDHDIWERAKKRAPGAPWGVITNIYKHYGGRIKGRQQVGASDSQAALAKGTLHEYEHSNTLDDLLNSIKQDLHDFNMLGPIQKALLDRFYERLESYKRITIERIAKDHLAEDPQYYDKLERMEKGIHAEVGKHSSPIYESMERSSKLPADQIVKGVNEEKQEHKSTLTYLYGLANVEEFSDINDFIDKAVFMIVRDHLKKDKEYYDKLELTGL